MDTLKSETVNIKISQLIDHGTHGDSESSYGQVSDFFGPKSCDEFECEISGKILGLGSDQTLKIGKDLLEGYTTIFRDNGLGFEEQKREFLEMVKGDGGLGGVNLSGLTSHDVSLIGKRLMEGSSLVSGKTREKSSDRDNTFILSLTQE